MSTISKVTVLEKFGKLRRAINLAATQELKALGIGPKQAIILRQIARDETSSLSEIARATYTDPAAVSRALESLLAKKWVEQVAHPTDRRRWDVLLTAKGKEQIKEIETIYRKLAARFLAPLSEAEELTFSNLLEKLLNGPLSEQA